MYVFEQKETPEERQFRKLEASRLETLGIGDTGMAVGEISASFFGIS